MSEGFAGGRIHIEPGHRIVAEAARARIFSDPERREAVDVKCDDFDGVVLYVAVSPEQKEVMRVSIFAPCFAQIKEAVGDRYFEELYHSVGASIEAAQPGYSLTVAVNLDALPADDASKGEPLLPLWPASAPRLMRGARLCGRMLLGPTTLSHRPPPPFISPLRLLRRAARDAPLDNEA